MLKKNYFIIYVTFIVLFLYLISCDKPIIVEETLSDSVFERLKKEETQKEREGLKNQEIENNFEDEINSLKSTEKEKQIKLEELIYLKNNLDKEISIKIEKKNRLNGEEKEKSYKKTK